MELQAAGKLGLGVQGLGPGVLGYGAAGEVVGESVKLSSEEEWEEDRWGGTWALCRGRGRLQEAQFATWVILSVEESSGRAKRYELLNAAVQRLLIVLIVLSIVFDIIQTDQNLLNTWNPIFHRFDRVATFVFTVEYILRLWSCVVDESFTSRVAFLLSPLALLDLLNVVGFWASEFADMYSGTPSSKSPTLSFLRTMRMLRFFKVFHFDRFTQSMKRLGKVLEHKNEELQVSTFLSFCLLLMCSSAMYVLEHDSGSEDFSSIMNSMYVTVPAMLGGSYGVDINTTAGKYLASAIGFIGVGLLAMPTAILGSGFVEMGEESDGSQIPEKTGPGRQQRPQAPPSYGAWASLFVPGVEQSDRVAFEIPLDANQYQLGDTTVTCQLHHQGEARVMRVAITPGGPRGSIATVQHIYLLPPWVLSRPLEPRWAPAAGQQPTLRTLVLEHTRRQEEDDFECTFVL
uniref:Ion transport domain-containing protein n=1 Tax=Rhizochromulina marina TaxID=1034831 RepID=A0A7S2SQI4_9STRA|mmetsp:Transcript_4356/g.12979  ORF Transcript_4356/g.12979 Transcript_4356/m.12979 type:complete len:459 (+) Transcript_4356:172-1548(+)|eukprot:CAMPEP_0118973120 /NCGR_PEP_ID=MMETSP1173-20130426/9209_1 /TAXON_ID=1034831 /ORGANISM="Rhizochromulina marina cf, Strain CCMP1243" /LENGTH=458 /DNA_ID=CAMNT_0006922731 /DNA_START=150 /DNA_END=1526 /DNA_ORIENTATION=+